MYLTSCTLDLSLLHLRVPSYDERVQISDHIHQLRLAISNCNPHSTLESLIIIIQSSRTIMPLLNHLSSFSRSYNLNTGPQPTLSAPTPGRVSQTHKDKANSKLKTQPQPLPQLTSLPLLPPHFVRLQSIKSRPVGYRHLHTQVSPPNPPKPMSRSLIK
ncbi:uncharacterized protein EAE97_004127 [Botrytis byssoidea]|uniref:Uncharacterized protein n=1 Tax=Botrytis byssoidea TaxID=139641 RepID=A0A9P5M0K8_9HELO|nr:uncharacterized protein EAE97_004127 [Botrytis byssoidea]KAF7946878.1 hypothetical protein EAE97_004127 [Botrytis byssoidea]